MADKTQISSKSGIWPVVIMALSVVFCGVFLFFSWKDSIKFYNNNLTNSEANAKFYAKHVTNELNLWVNQQFHELEKISNNKSLKIYFTELLQYQSNNNQIKSNSYQNTYVRNLLEATAAKNHFGGEKASNIKASLNFLTNSGIFLVDQNQNIIVSTDPQPQIGLNISDHIKSSFGKNKSIKLYDIQQNNSFSELKNILAVFMLPIHNIQGENAVSDQVGAVVAIKPIGPEISAILQQQANVNNYIELVLSDSSNTLYSTKPKENQTTNKVLEASSNLEILNWQVQYKEDFAKAMVIASLKQKLSTSYTAISLIFLSFLAYILFAKPLKQNTDPMNYKEIASKLGSQNLLLKLIINNSAESILVVNTKNECLFMNNKMQQSLDKKLNEYIGKNIKTFLPKQEYREIKELNFEALQREKEITNVKRYFEDNKEKVGFSIHIPFYGPIGEFLTEKESAVLILKQDASSMQAKHEGVISSLNFLVDALVKVIDNRDKYTADHSIRVSELANEIAKEMGLSDNEMHTIRIAGKLMNLGKAFLPIELLQRSSNNSEVEQNMIRESVVVSAQLLEGIEFEGPVLETIRESNEYIDGSGTLGKKNDEIIIYAKIIATANKFVTLTNPRAFQTKRNVSEALNILLEESGKKFDRSVVAALVNYMENGEGRFLWQVTESIEASNYADD